MVIVIAHARHGERAGRPERLAERGDQAFGAALNWTYFRKCGVDEKNPAGLDSQAEELFAEFCSGDRPPHAYMILRCMARRGRDSANDSPPDAGGEGGER